MKNTLLVLATLLSGCNSITNKNSCEYIYNNAIIAELEGNNEMGASFRRNAAAKACLVFMDGVYSERKWEKQDHCYNDVLRNSSILVSGRNISIGLKGKQDISKVKTQEDGTVECSIVSLNYQVFYEGKELPTDRYKPRINYTYREFDDGSGYDYQVNIEN